jgi:hypothetical protein
MWSSVIAAAAVRAPMSTGEQVLFVVLLVGAMALLAWIFLGGSR